MSMIPVATDTFITPYSLDNITGLRFQPLVELKTGRIIAHEVLVEVKTVSPEDFFTALTPEYTLALFFWQAKEILRSHYSERFWLNLPVAVFLDPQAITRLCSFQHQYRLTLEIQDPENVVTLDTFQRKSLSAALQQLKNAGWQVWLDDLSSATEMDISLLCLPVDGVKIDRLEMQHHDRLKKLIAAAKNDFSSPVLVEGIESKSDVKRLIDYGARYGQGFLWPELKTPVVIPRRVAEQAEEWRIEAMLLNSDKLKIAICCVNSWFKEGIMQLISTLLYDPFKSNVWSKVSLVEQDDDADIVFRYCLPGQLPFDCQRFHNDAAYQARILRKRYVILHDGLQPHMYCRCPVVATTLSSKNSLEQMQNKLMNLLNATAGRLNPTPPSLFTGFCRACQKRALTTRESEAVISLGKGNDTSSVARQMGCTIKNVSFYKRSVMEKLNLSTNLEFMQYAHWLSTK